MKNNKSTPQAIARRLRFNATEPELAVLLSLPIEKAFQSELDAIAALSLELIGQEKMTVPGITMPNGETLSFDKPVARIAMESTAQGNRENAPELYGRSLRETRQKYAGDIRAYSSPGGSCDVETSEIESALLASIGNVNMGEANEATED